MRPFIIKHISIKYQLILLLVLIVIILAILLNFSFFYNTKIIEKKMIEFNNQVNVQVHEKIDNFIKKEDVYMRSFLNDGAMQAYYEQTRDKDFNMNNDDALMKELKKAAVKHMILNSSVYDIIITDQRGNTIYYYCKDDNIQKLTQPISKLSTGIIYDNNNYMYTLSQPVFWRNTSNQIGSVTFVYYMSSLKEVLGNNMEVGYISYYIVNSEQRIIAGPSHSNIGQKTDPRMASVFSRPGQQMKYTLVDKDILIQAKTIGDWTIMSMTPITEMMYGVLQIRYSSILIWFACILIILIIYILFFRNLTRSVSHLLSIMKLVRLGNFDTRANMLHSRELNLLGQGFNKMMDRIVELMGQNATYQKKLYEVEISNRQAKLQALQSQINPHFLYNTLEVMKSIGVYHGIKEIEDTAVGLAYIFRYSIKGEDLVKVSEEMQSVMYYLSIQQVRFMDKIDVKIHVNEQVADSFMLKFLLQPIVENSIYHGLEQKPGKGSIQIRTEYDSYHIKFIVEDDGVGIEKVTLNRIKEDLVKEHTITLHNQAKDRSLGLVNIHNRIRLFYGNDYGLEIHSDVSTGTIVIINIPRGFDNHVQSDDR